MSYQDTIFSKVENVGLIESAVRGALSLSILLSILLIPAISSTALFALTLAAIYAGLTASLSWDPLYALVTGPRHQLPGRVEVPAKVAIVSRRTGQTAGDIHHKRAA